MTPRRVLRLLITVLLAACCAVGLAPAAAADALRSGQWYLSSLGIERAWSVTRGAGVKVAVVDSGVDGSIPVLRGAVVGGRDFSGQGSANGQAGVSGTEGPDHGTAVASLLAGRGSGPNSGVIGSAPGADLLSCSVATGAGDSSVQIANAIRWAADHGAKVINISLGTTTDLAAVTAAVRDAQARDVVLVAAAGNQGMAGLAPPASLPGVIAVSGIDRNLRADPMSNYGHGVAVVGPYATTPDTGIPVALRRGSPTGPYAQSTGTSLAAPVVAGIVALIRAKYPSLDAANVINRLIKTATPTGGAAPNDKYGFGIPNAYRALTAPVPSVSANPLGSLVPAGGGATAGTGGRSSPPGSTAPKAAPASTPATGSSGSSGGVWAALAGVVVVLAVIVGWFVVRSRRSRTSGTPTQHARGYGPQQPRPPQAAPRPPLRRQGPPPPPPPPPPRAG